MKKLLAFLAALTVVGTAIGKTVKIAYPNWAEGIAMTHLVKAVLEDDMGYNVKLTQADPGVIYAALASGDQDVFLDAWLPHTHADYWAKYGKHLENLGTTYGYGVTGLVVPDYMKINSIEQLNSIAGELHHKIIGIGTGAGITKNTNKAIQEYDLDFKQINSSGPAMTAALANAIKQHKPIVVTGWKPHWMFGRFHLKFLADPRGVYPIDGIRKIGRPGFRKDMPKVADFLENFTLTDKQLLSLMLAIDKSNDDPQDVASDWARNHAPLVDSWIPRN